MVIIPTADAKIGGLRSRIQLLPARALSLARAHPMAVIFIVIAVGVRMVFWLYTRRIWEDALITTTPARNLWLGNGLTHHVSEPRVHSFTSPISVLVPIVGESIRQGILALRLASLIGSVFTIIFAYRIALLLRLSIPAQIFLLGYLATDQLQIFFGMAGMETQLATAILLANVFFLLRREWTKLGLCCGLAMLARPEFILWLGIAFVVLVILDWRAIFRWAAACAAVAGPWFIFATIYYGSPIPHTIVAKSNYNSGGILHGLNKEKIMQYLDGWWTVLAPFREYTFAVNTPIPTFFLQLIALTFLVLMVIGLWHGSRRQPLVLAIGAFIAIFFLYRTATLLPTYFMWYLPPVTALGAVLAAIGIDRIRLTEARFGTAMACVLAFAFAMHIPFSYPLEKRVQRDIENDVRWQVGLYLNRTMGPNDTVVLEPLGYIGFAAFNKTTYDYPGLSSYVVTNALKSVPPEQRGLGTLFTLLQPNFVVVRENEYNAFKQFYPDTMRKYDVAATFIAPPTLNLTNHGLSYFNIDTNFIVLHRHQ